MIWGGSLGDADPLLCFGGGVLVMTTPYYNLGGVLVMPLPYYDLGVPRRCRPPIMIWGGSLGDADPLV